MKTDGTLDEAYQKWFELEAAQGSAREDEHARVVRRLRRTP